MRRLLRTWDIELVRSPSCWRFRLRWRSRPASSSSFQAGPGLLKALARGGGIGILPGRLGRTNRYHTPYWGVVVFLAASALMVVAAGSREQRLVLFYAVAVFVAFLCGLLAMT